MWYLSESIDDLDLINVVDGRAQPAVDTEYCVVNHNAECEKIEHIGKVLPHGGRAVFASAFQVESVRLIVSWIRIM